MSSIQYPITLDLKRDYHQVLIMKEGDVDSREIIITVTDNGKIFDVTNHNIKVKWHKPDHTIVFNDCTITDDEKILIICTEQMLIVDGIAKCEVVIYDLDNETVLSTMPFDVSIRDSVVDNKDIESSNEFLSLARLLFGANGMFNTLKEHISNKLNPHNVTKEQVGLGNVDNTADIDKDVNSAKKLTTARNINGTSFDGTEDVVTDKWGKERTITLSGDVSASTVLDGSSDVDIEVTVEDDSHNHKVSNISDLTASADELNIMDGVTATTDEINILDGLIATTEELNYVSGVTSNIQTQLDDKAPLDSPNLTGTPTAPTAPTGTNTTQIATTAFVQNAVSEGIAASDALIFKGTLGTTGTITALPTTYKTGWTYRVVTDGTYAGQVCEIGDLIIALVDREDVDNADSDWCVAQTNIDGAVTGIKNGDTYITVSQSGSIITITHSDVSRANTTSITTPLHGGTFTAIKSVTSDSKGHITGVDTETVTLPDADISLSDTSTNPVQNKVVKGALDAKGDVIYYDKDNSQLQLKSGDNVISSTKIIGGGSGNIDEMTGATKEKDGTSGTVPAPLAGQENLFLRGDGTWAEAKQDLSAYYNNANYDTKNNKLQLMNGDTVLKEFEISGGAGTKIPPKATVDPVIINGNAKVTITWGDPEDVIADGVVLSTWKGTKLVMSETGYPENENDGTVLVDNTERDAYKTSGYEVTGLTNGNTYYFALFPYSTDGVYNYQTSNRLLGTPSLVKLDACTDMSINAEMGSVTVSWTDPDAEKTVDENTAIWAKTVLVYKQGSSTPSSISDGIVAVEETERNQYSVDGFTVDGLTDGEQYSFSLFAVSTENVSSDATTKSVSLWATLTITTDETTLYEKEVTATYDSNTVSGTFSSSGSVTLQIPWIGETTITSTDDTDTATSKVTISAYETSYNMDLSFLKIVTFADGTDEEIAAMMQAHYDNKINISDYWAVGDKRSVNLSAMSATYAGESHRAQTIQFAIADFGKDELSTPINGHTMAAITLTQVNCLMDATSASNSNNGSSDTEKGYMNSSNTNVGGWTDCARRKWCNEVYYNALPSVFRSMVKEVNKKTSAGNQSSTINITKDKAFLLSESEIYGSTTYSKSGEGTQYEYYKTTANRYKLPKWTSSRVSQIWWERSPYSGSSAYFCNVNYSGSAYRYNASSAYGVAPCLCI